MKRTLYLALALIMVLGLAASVRPAASVKAQDEETLELYLVGLPDSALTWFNDVAFPAFEAEHPGVKMELLNGTWADFYTTVAGWITTGEGPDLVYLGSEHAATFCDLLSDLDPYLADWDGLDAFLPAALETVSCDGHMRGMPLLMSPRPIFYRTDLTADPANFAAPLTFADALQFVTDNTVVENGAVSKQGFMDIGGQLFDDQEFIAYIWSAGGELYYEDGTSTFDSPETAEALQYMYDRRRVVLPTEDTAGLPPIEGTPLGSGVVVSGIFPMWNVPPLDDAVWESVAIAPYPAGANGQPLIQVFIDWLSVPSYVENKELAVEFLKFITTQENALALSEVAGFTPVRQDAWETIKANSPVWTTLLDLAVEYGRAYSDIRAAAELRPLIFNEVNLFLTDQQSLEDTQTNLKEAYDAILEEQGYLD